MKPETTQKSAARPRRATGPNGSRREYVAARLGPSESVRELTRAAGGSLTDGGSGGMSMMMGA